MTRRLLAFVAVFAVSVAAGAEQPAVQLFAAGSLRGAMTEIVRAFTATGGPEVNVTYGGSGLLRERIEKGESVEVFAAADLGNPQTLASAGRALAPVVFARNSLCALAGDGVDAESNTLLGWMLLPGIKIGTSTPKADSSGDDAWRMFEQAERLRPGAFKALDAKALKLTGGADSPAPSAGRSVYATAIADGTADIFVTYCTDALPVLHEVPKALVITPPNALRVVADYGLTVMTNASPGAQDFAAFLISPPAQTILMRFGFAPGDTL